ncbi:hypothetical protein ACLB2K_038560 [Fragaria x ananassa]
MSEDFSEEEVSNEARGFRNYYGEDDEDEIALEEEVNSEGLRRNYDEDEKWKKRGRQFDEDDENEEQGESYDEDEDDLYWPARALAKLEVYMQAMKDYEEKCHVDVNSGFKKRGSPTEFNAQILRSSMLRSHTSVVDIHFD